MNAAAIALALASQIEPGRITTIAPCPAVPEGFVLELVMHHPEVKWPSAVHCLEDGSLLVAEDPMDMPGPADQPIDRIWRVVFAEDGTFTKTQFAEGLYAVMGLQEIDGDVFVMNMPHLTVLRDRDGDGVAEERRELITDLGPPAPGWPGGFNDHIVSGLRLGMDGFLYVSVGDKGVPLAHGTDGSEIQLRGGGVVRVRPDGSRLEVVATGTRNHLDVLMDERDEMFTYDNTDDGLGWWTRVTHIVTTGYYGYPWDYHDFQERMLPPMTDFGGGSPVGGLCYREDAWPEELRGDLFWCEWAKRTVRRIRVERAGATFKVVHDEDFITAVEGDEFRPLDVCESPDGRYVYIADWNYPGWVNPQVAGRVWRLRRAEDRPGAPPAGGVRDMTVATLAQASDSALLENLAHPGFRRRLAAQRELSRRGEAAHSLVIATALSHPDERARRHATWALANSSGPPVIPGLCGALVSESADTRAQAARALGELRARDAAAIALLWRLLADDDPVVRREAAVALGRCGDRSALEPLVRALDSTEDLFVRFAIRQAIRALPCDWADLVHRLLPAAGPRAQEDLWLALREIHDAALIEQLVAAAKAESMAPPARARALAVLAEAHRKAPPWDGKWWSIDPARHPRPAKTIEWEGTALVVETIRAALETPIPELRTAAIAAVRSTREPALLPPARARLEQSADPAERIALTVLLAELRDGESAPLIARGLEDPAPELRAAAVAALHRVQGDAALDAIRARLSDPDAGVRLAAVRAFGDSSAASITDEVLPHCFEPTTRDAAFEALARHPDARALGAYLAGLSIEGAPREASRRALHAVREEARPAVEGLAARGEIDAAALPILREIYDEPPPIPQWRLVGPFERGAHPPELEAGAPGSVEAALAAPFGGKDGEPARLVDATASMPHGFVDLRSHLSGRSEVAAYAFARIESPLARVARVRLGSDDAATLWVNGAKVHEFAGDRSWTPDQDRFEVPLIAGVNDILLRVDQGGGDWSFNLKVSGAASGPLFEGVAGDPSALAAGGEPGPPPSPDVYRAFALANAGDPELGRALFHDPAGSGCFRCHPIAGEGPKIGPDLRDVGAKYPRPDLIASILEPSARIAEGYTSTHVFLKSGDVLSVLLIGEQDGRVKLADSRGDVRELAREEIAETRASPLSAMPAGLHEQLTPRQLADLVAWLETLRQ